MLVSTNVFRHSAQKSKSCWPSSCFCSSDKRYLDWVISHLPAPWSVTRQTRKLVPPLRKYEKPSTEEILGLTEIDGEIVASFVTRRPSKYVSRDHGLVKRLRALLESPMRGDRHTTICPFFARPSSRASLNASTIIRILWGVRVNL